ncbi:hypothetical protein ACP4OV_026687 [Aristida adscensionis]
MAEELTIFRRMEELSNLGGGAAQPPPPLPPSSRVSVQVYTVPSSTTTPGGGAWARDGAPVLLHASAAAAAGGGHGVADLDPVKARIVSHPRYRGLLAAFLDCHKVVFPPEAAEEIAAAALERAAQQRAAVGDGDGDDDPAGTDPELDQFMEAYCELLVVWREQLSRPLREAEEFLTAVESQLSSIAGAGPPLGALISAAEEKFDLDPSDDEEDEITAMEAEEALGIARPRSDDKELKRHLLKKYSGCLGTLRKELCKTRKKGKLPKEARQKLLSWWELHYRWPYPSEVEKMALAESTGLEQKQINNWFINQRKRHWKPAEEMPFAAMAMDGACFHPAPPQSAALLAVDGRLVGALPAVAYALPEHGGLSWHN